MVELRNEELRLARDHSTERRSRFLNLLYMRSQHALIVRLKLQERRAELQERKWRLGEIRKLHEEDKEQLRLQKEKVEEQR